MSVLERVLRSLEANTPEQADDLAAALQEFEKLREENRRMEVDAWDLRRELEVRVGVLTRALLELPDEANEVREEMRSELACIDETLKRCEASARPVTELPPEAPPTYELGTGEITPDAEGNY